jgi:multidrug efflux pump subunit AcrA (membrane-fusion protein)
MRKAILTVVGLAILVLAYFGAKLIVDSNTKQRPKPLKEVKTVFVDTIQNDVVPIVVTANGNLIAKRRLELYAEVQGVLKAGPKLFKAGQEYRQGETIIRIDAAEFYASVQSQKSNLFNQVSAIMPDIRLDYPEVFDKWQGYLASFDIDKSIPSLPSFDSDKEKYFISGRGILTSYYNVKNLEQRLSKYSIRAPFNGILTEALVTEGTLIRASQKLGEFIDTGRYELPVSINKAYGDFLKVGETVQLTNLDSKTNYLGTVSRINGNIDVASQTINAFIEVAHPSLREGLYLEAKLDARKQDNAVSLARNLLQPDDQLFVVRDTILDLIDVTPVFFSEKSVVVQGIPDGTLVISKPVPGAYAGMLVKIFGQKKDASKDEVEAKKQAE